MNLSKNLWLVRSIVILVVIAAAMMIAQLWFEVFSYVFFWKILATVVILGLVISFIIAVMADFSSEKSMKDDKYLD